MDGQQGNRFVKGLVAVLPGVRYGAAVSNKISYRKANQTVSFR
jgi:hypothetical protein